MAALLFAVSASATAQEAESELWVGFEQQHKINREWRLGLSQDLRWDQDVERLHEVMPGFGVSYRGLDVVRLDLGYRLELAQDDPDEWTTDHRLTLDGRASRELGDLELSYRLRLQSMVNEVALVARNRGRVAYEGWHDWTPYADLEVFTPLTDTPGKWRGRLGLEVELGDHELGAYAMVVQGIDDPDGHPHHVVGLSYGLKF